MRACDYCGRPGGYHAEADWNPYREMFVCGDCRQRGITDWDALKRYSAAHPNDPHLMRYRESEQRDERERAERQGVLTAAQQPTHVVNVRHKEPFDVYIGRHMPRYPELRATGFGNPFKLQRGATPDEVAQAIANYRAWLIERPQLMARLPELRGKTLGCWCAPPGGLTGDLNGRICHGEILAALADGLGDDAAASESVKPEA